MGADKGWIVWIELVLIKLLVLFMNRTYFPCLHSHVEFFIPIPRHKLRLYNVNFFLRHYGGQLKTPAEQEVGDRLWKITTKSKRNNTLKMLSFCGVFNCSNCADKDKDKSNYHSLSIVKNNSKEDLKLSKVRKEEKWLAQIFRKDLTGTKLERTITLIKIMLSASPSSVFFSQNSQYQIWKANTYSILTKGNWPWTDSVAVIHLNLKVLWRHWFWTQISLKKRKSKIGYP